MASPVKSMKVSGVEVAVWARDGQYGTEYSVSLQKSYKDKEGNWKTTNFLKKNDIPIARTLLQKAIEFIYLQPKTKPQQVPAQAPQQGYTQPAPDDDIPF